MDTCSSTMAAHSPQLSLVQELPQLTPSRVGQLDIKDEITMATRNPSDATPTPCEAAQRLARFTKKVQCKRKSPLIVSPPRQKAVTSAPANQEQVDCRSTVVARTDLQVGRDTTHEEDGHRAAGGTSFFRANRAYDAIFAANLTSS
jgi:hypothetical protein